MSTTQTGELRKIAEGREAEIFAWDEGHVLRLLREPGAEGRLEHEAAAMEAARSAGVAVPAVREIVTVMGRPGMVMERVDGPDMLTLLGKKPWTIVRVGRVTGQLHAALNQVPAPGSLGELRATVERRIREIPAPPELAHLPRFALDTLAKLPDGDAICHGDFHPGNIIDGSRGPMIIDWPNVTRGNADADFSRTMLMLRLGEPPPGAPALIVVMAKFARQLLIQGYRRNYLARRAVDKDTVERWQIVRAAERIADGIESERPKLIALLQTKYERRAEAAL